MARCTEGPYVFFWREEDMYHLPRKIKAASSLRSRWSHIPGGEQKAEDADGKIDQEDAAPPKRVDQHTSKERTRKGPEACDCCPDANRPRPFPGVRKDHL